MPRVTLFIDSLAAGGAQRQVVELARALRAGPWQPRVAWYRPEPPFVRLPEGVPGVAIPRAGRHDPRFVAMLRATLHRRRTDLVHAFLGPPSLYAVFARQFLGGAPLVSAVRMSGRAFPEHPVDAACHLAAALLGDHTCANAEDVLPWMRARGVPAERLSYTPNLLRAAVAERVPLSAQRRRAVLEAYGLCPAVPPLTLVGRFDEYKNQDGLVRALGALRSEGLNLPPVLLIGARTGPGRAEKVRRLAAELELPRLVIAPPTPDILAVLQSSRLLVLVSHSEGTPNIVMEALGLGVLVAATPVGQVPMLVRDGRTGLLATDTSDAAIAAVLRTALTMAPDAAAAMGERARRDVLARFSARTLAAQMVDLYDLAGRRRPPPRLRAARATALALARLARAPRGAPGRQRPRCR